MLYCAEWVGTDSVTSAFSKSPVFVCPHVHPKTALLVWTEAVSVKKMLKRKKKTDTCRQGLRKCLEFTSSTKREIWIFTWWATTAKKCTKQRHARAHFSFLADQPIAVYRCRCRCRHRCLKVNIANRLV